MYINDYTVRTFKFNNPKKWRWPPNIYCTFHLRDLQYVLVHHLVKYMGFPRAFYLSSQLRVLGYKVDPLTKGQLHRPLSYEKIEIEIGIEIELHRTDQQESALVTICTAFQDSSQPIVFVSLSLPRYANGQTDLISKVRWTHLKNLRICCISRWEIYYENCWRISGLPQVKYNMFINVFFLSILLTVTGKS